MKIALLTLLLACSCATSQPTPAVLASRSILTPDAPLPAFVLECPSPEVARANANLLEAQRALYACSECSIGRDLVAAAVEQKRIAVYTTCAQPVPATVARESLANPWEDTKPDPAELAWWCEVFGQCTH
jgi:hypothetical protein